jgi:hypothetical protein
MGSQTTDPLIKEYRDRVHLQEVRIRGRAY